MAYGETPTLNGLFSTAQITQGAQLFARECVRCHSAEQVSGFAYQRWQDKTLGDLFDVVRKTMPPESAGRLQGQDYLDVLAFVLSRQQHEAGAHTIAISQHDWREVVIRPPLVTARSPKAAERNWTAYRGDVRSQGYSPADQINRHNVKDLKIAWRWSGRNFGPSPELKSITTPLMVDGVLYLTAGLTRNVVAVDAASGETLWMWRPDEGKRFDTAPRKGAGRGVAYWRNPKAKGRILTVTPGFQLVALDALTGLPVSTFGDNGVVDLRQGLRRAKGRDLDIGSSSPPLVIGDVVVVGPAHESGTRPPSKRNVKGDVRAYSAVTGKHLWTFDTIPAPGAARSNSWEKNTNAYTGNAGVWAPMSGDPELGLVYLPVESPTNDYYGGERPGDNRYANSLVCLDARTGKLRWYFQTTHHDIWDWDLPAAPILVDIPRKTGIVKAVAQLTKQAFVYVFNRETGQPLWPIEERPAPPSDVPGEKTSPTQPVPKAPAPFDRQGITADDLIDFTPALRAAALEAIKPYRLGQFYAGASLANAADGTHGTLMLPSPVGGANWEGGVVDPETGMLYVGSMTLPVALALEPSPPGSDSGYVGVGVGAVPTVDGLPVVKPPWGRITAIDLKTGQHAWMVPNGDAPETVKQHPMLQGIDIGRTGKQTRSGLLVTKTLLFAGEGWGVTGEGWGGSPVLRAHDKQTGGIVAEIHLPGAQTGLPMSYVWQGKQYIVMAVGDGEQPAELVALSLP
ncbi:outer membrane protein assembly factor BamB family protein [Kineobactrum salinum]|uniref:PQQ-binding-like beta-propeller repeat protein n=1 Tax=Kineobactrum salinum TaxID=2708301 RepID=A0A6C0U1A6_9GAMM|nr:PQQ-binding-like beta-propeller repeat protein [Kineobactrum salinum]QIB64105.1 PQQ-binding-like beta-propeller repeat protein [Kineobactrum salinum]